MAEKVRCEICDRTFKDAEGLAQHNASKHDSTEVKKKESNFKISKGWVIFFVIIIGVIALVWWGISSVKTLPPTDQIGHVEANPPSHVMREPMPILIQKHMLEHADGTGSPGIIINYNCEDYTCEAGLIENLEAFATRYPANVYVATFKNMDAKIVLTRQGRLQILEEYDELAIDGFINSR